MLFYFKQILGRHRVSAKDYTQAMKITKSADKLFHDNPTITETDSFLQLFQAAGFYLCSSGQTMLWQTIKMLGFLSPY